VPTQKSAGERRSDSMFPNPKFRGREDGVIAAERFTRPVRVLRRASGGNGSGGVFAIATATTPEHITLSPIERALQNRRQRMFPGLPERRHPAVSTRTVQLTFQLFATQPLEQDATCCVLIAPHASLATQKPNPSRPLPASRPQKSGLSAIGTADFRRNSSGFWAHTNSGHSPEAGR
jgi:hypothetical protein